MGWKKKEEEAVHVNMRTCRHVCYDKSTILYYVLLLKKKIITYALSYEDIDFISVFVSTFSKLLNSNVPRKKLFI